MSDEDLVARRQTVKTHDGAGQPIADEALYYVQDGRQIVGNCAMFWGKPPGNGYVCDLREAGLYSGERVRSMRTTDIPWPMDLVLAQVVWHVRGDVEPFVTARHEMRETEKRDAAEFKRQERARLKAMR